MKKILDYIDQAISQEKSVFIHCWGGKGRTGTVVGCFLARHGIAMAKEALEKIKDLRKNDSRAHEVSPETDRQRYLVWNWRQEE
jgi:protein-tyrosine phosphatase